MTEPGGTEESKDFRKMNVVFMRRELGVLPEDRYLVDMAVAMKDAGHMVLLIMSKLDQSDALDEIKRFSGCVDEFSWGWKLFRKFPCLLSILMAFRIVFFPPTPKPDLIVVDVHPIAGFLISKLSSAKTLYVKHFRALRNEDVCRNCLKVSSSLVACKSLKHVDGILVQSQALAEVFKRSLPNVRKEVHTLHACVDTGMWRAATIDIKWLIPDMPDPSFMFACFGDYRVRSNFQHVLKAFEHVLAINEGEIRNNLHLVIAGNCYDNDLTQSINYKELLYDTTFKPVAAQVTFLKHLSTLSMKTLIDESIAVIIPGEQVFPGMILPVLAAGRPLICAHNGFANEALEHGRTALLVDTSSEMFAEAMVELLNNTELQVALSDNGRELFETEYSNDAYKKKLNSIVMKCVGPPK